MQNVTGSKTTEKGNFVLTIILKEEPFALKGNIYITHDRHA
jgi:hypothetical protein